LETPRYPEVFFLESFLFWVGWAGLCEEEEDEEEEEEKEEAGFLSSRAASTNKSK